MPNVQLSKAECSRRLIPRVCVRCGKRADVFKTRNFGWYPPALTLAFPFGGLPFLILVRILMKRMKVDVPFCKADEGYWVTRALVALPILAVLAIGAITALAVSHDTGLPPVVMYVIGGALAAAFLGVALAVKFTTIRPVRITDRSITLARVHPAFIAALECDREEDRAADERPARRKATDSGRDKPPELGGPPALPRRDRDDRPRDADRRDDRDFDSEPRRGRRGDRRREEPKAKRPSVPGALALLFGISGLTVSIIPFIGAFGLIGAGVGLILGVIGLVLAKKSGGRVGSGLPLAGTLVSVAGLVCGGAWLALFTFILGMKPADKGKDAVADAGRRPPQAGRKDPAPAAPEQPPADPADGGPPMGNPAPPAGDLNKLVERLKKGDDRAGAAEEIGQLGPKGLPAVPELVRTVDDPDPAVADKVVAALVAVGRRPLTAVLAFKADWCGPCREMKPILDKLTAEGLPIVSIDIDEHPQLSDRYKVRSVPTFVALRDEKETGREVGYTPEAEFREFAAKVGKPAQAARPDDAADHAALLAAVLGLGGDDPWDRFAASAALRSRAGAVTQLTGLLDAKYPARIRAAAIGGMLSVGGSELPEPTREALGRLLADEKEAADVRGYAAVALTGSKAPPAAAAPALLAAVESGKSPDLRGRAADRLGELRPPGAVPPLTRGLGDNSETVRRSAAVALGKLGPDALPAVPALLEAAARDEDHKVREALDRVCASTDAGPALAKAVGHKDAEVRLLALELLGQTGDAGAATKELEKALSDENPRVRVRAASALQQVGEHDKVVLPVLVSALGDKDNTGEADGALMQMGRRAVPELVKSVTAPERPAAGRMRAARLLAYAKLPAATVADLKSALKSDDPVVRTGAAVVLARRPPADEAVGAALIAGAKDKDAQVRHDCLRALGEARPPGAVAPLLAALGGRDDEGRFEAAMALARFDLDEKAVDQVIALLNKKATRPAAAQVLGTVGRKWPKAIPALVRVFVTSKEEGRDSVGTALTSIGKSAAPALIKVAEEANRDEEVRADAVTAVSRMGPPAAEVSPKLAGLLKDKSELVRFRVALALAEVTHDPAAVPELVDSLKDDEDEATRAEAARALGSIGPKAVAASGRLKELLEKAGQQERFPLAVALAQVTRDTDAGVPALLALLRTGADDQQRQAAVSALHTVGKPAIPHLVAALADDHSSKPEVIRVLSGFGNQAKEAGPQLVKLLADKDWATALAAAEALATIDPAAEAAVPVLAEALRSPEPAVRQRAVFALGRFGKAARPAVPALIQALKDPSVRASAAYTLGRIGPDAAEAVGPLTALLGTREGPSAARALADIGPKAAPAVPALIKLLDREQSAAWAAGALGHMGPEAKPAVAALLKKVADDNQRLAALRALPAVAPLDPDAVLQELVRRASDPDPECRAVALSGLGGQKGDKVVPVLLKALDDPDSDVQEAAVHALSQTGPDAAPAVPALIALLRSKVPALRQAAAGALGELGPTAEPAVMALMDALADKATRGSAAYALGRIGPKAARAVPALVKLLDEPEPPVEVIEALGEMGPPAKDALPALRKLVDHPDEDVGPAAKEAIERIEGKK